MKKLLQNVLFRALVILVFGILLLAFSGEISLWIVYVSGAMFMALGTVAFVSYLKSKTESRPSVIYPVVAIGCVLFGVVQVLFPALFSGALRYLLSGFLMILSIVQVVSLILLRKHRVDFSWMLYLIPLAELGVALYVCLYEKQVKENSQEIFILGIGYLLYALLEFWIAVLLRRVKDDVDVVPLGDEEVQKIE